MEATKTEELLQILVVDDEENILRSLKRLLEHEEYEVLIAASGEEALKIIIDNPDVALIVTDQRMPGLKGAEFLQKAKALVPDASRIVLTGYADINAAIDAINKGGASGYLTKPWDDDEMLQVVNEAVLRFALKRDNKKLTQIVKKQNEELTTLNSRLKQLVKEQTIEIQQRNEELQGLNENLKHNFKNTIESFSSLLELRDEGAGNHSRNVAELSKKIAMKMDLSEDEIQSVSVASLLHDIGKIGIPDTLLFKDINDMKAEEKAVYEQHPVRGQAAIDSIKDLREAGILIRHHHEWYDGGGYPDRLSGGEIPVGARIISVADYIDRIIRTFNPEEAIELTLQAVQKEMGKRFDRKLYHYIPEPLEETYGGILQKTSLVEAELHLKDLQPGMVISKDVRSGTGLLLLSKGTKLSARNIESLNRLFSIDPSSSGIIVMVER